jgi:CBS domain-containing protein
LQNTKPSPAISVTSDTSIRETLRIMRKHNVGSVLINSYSAPHGLEGIFTERDLLKWVGEIEKNNAWDKAISTIMTRKMITLNVLELDRAAEIMLEHGFRHVPIVYDSAQDGLRHVAGVVSMRDLFQSLIAERKERQVLNRFQGKRVYVLAHSQAERELQRKLLEDHVDLVVNNQEFSARMIDRKSLISSALSADVVVMDLDHFSPDFWVEVLRRVLAEKNRPDVFLVYDPVLQDPKNVASLKQLSQGAVLHVFPKPINLLEYLRQLEKSLRNVKSPT